MTYLEFIAALRDCAGGFRWRLGYYHELRGSRGNRVDFSPLTAVAWHLSHKPLAGLPFQSLVRLLKLHPDLTFRIYQASERLNPYHPEITDDLLDSIGLKDFVGWGPPHDRGAITRPVFTYVP